MARTRSQYLAKLQFLAEQQKPFPLKPYDAPFDDWSREDKARLSRAYNKGQLSIATDAVAIRPDFDDYKTMAKTIRPFVKGFTAKDGYRFDDVENWTPNKKRQLTRYYKRAVELGSRPFETYHTTSKAAKDIALAVSGQGKAFPRFKGVLIPVQALGEDVNIHVDVKRATLEIDTATHRTSLTEWKHFGITPADLAADPGGVVRQVIEATGFSKYAIKAGEFHIGKGVPLLFTAGMLPAAVQRLIEKYSAEKHDPDDSNSHYFGNWLIGIEGFDFDSAPMEKEWGQKFLAESTQRKAYKVATRKRIRRQKGL